MASKLGAGKDVRFWPKPGRLEAPEDREPELEDSPVSAWSIQLGRSFEGMLGGLKEDWL